MNEQHVQRTDKIVSPQGCTLAVVTAEGQVMGEIPLPPGIHLAAQYWDLLEEDWHLETDGAVFAGRRAAHVQTPPDHLDTAANPDFQPTMMTDLEREARAMMRQLQAKYDALDARAAAFARESGQRMPDAPNPAPEPEATQVVE